VHNGKQNIAPVAASPIGRRLQESSTQNRHVICAFAKKNREENKFSSRAEVGIVIPKAVGIVTGAKALVPFFLRCFFLGGFFAFLCHRLIPPFQSAEAERL
jgi:hypothetical protein